LTIFFNCAIIVKIKTIFINFIYKTV